MMLNLGIVCRCILCACAVWLHLVHIALALDTGTSNDVTHDVIRPTDVIAIENELTANRSDESPFSIVQSDGKAKLVTFMDTGMMTSFNYSVVCKNRNVTYVLTATTQEPNVLRVSGLEKMYISCRNHTSKNVDVTSWSNTANTAFVKNGEFRLNLDSGLLGTGVIEFIIQEQPYSEDRIYTYNVTEHKNDVNVSNLTGKRNDVYISYTVMVLRKMRPVDSIFRITIYCVQVFVMMGFGVRLDLTVVKENLRRPIAPAIGLSCQYILMPLIAFAVANLVTVGDVAVSLGIFVAGCCPGGGGSNMYSYLLDGDLTLSVTMTMLSTIAALGMMPLWLYTLGSTFLEDQEINIPFINVATSLSIMIVPLLVGLLLQRKVPKVAHVIRKVLKPVTIFTVVILITVGFYSNAYIFRLFKPRVILAGCLLPYVGYFMGGLVATVLRRDWKRIKTIAIETGMQNTSIAYIILVTSFPPPMGDIAAVAPVASAIMTLIPPFLITIVYIIYGKCTNRNQEQKSDNDDDEKNPDVTTKLTNGDAGDVVLLEKQTVI